MSAKIEKDSVIIHVPTALNRGQKSLTVAARAWRPVPAAAGSPRYVVFEILRWDTITPGGCLTMQDTQTRSALLLRCTLLPDGSTRNWICLQGPDRYNLQTADLLWSVENAKVTLTRGKVGASWEGFAIDVVVRRLRAWPNEIYFWALHTGAQLDLLVVRGNLRIGVEIKRTTAPRVTPAMRSALAALQLQRLYVVHAGDASFPMGESIQAIPLASVLTELEPLR